MEAYWGPFAGLREAGVALEETDFYEGFHAHLYDLTTFANDEDVGDYLALADAHADPVLELGCGSGRVLLRLAQQGHRVVGIDASAAMIEILQRRLQALPPALRERVQVHQGDAATCTLADRFDLILLPAFSISLFLDRERRRRLFQWVHAHLQEGGTFAFDFVRYTEENRQALDGRVLTAEFPGAGGRIRSRYGVRFDPTLGQVLWNYHTEVAREDGTQRQYLSASRLAWVQEEEIAALLAECGLTVVAERRTPLAMGETVAERRLVRCSRRTAVAYPLWHPYLPMNEAERAVTVLVEGKGSRVQDRSGKEYIDLSGGLWSTQCGLGREEIIAAVNRQLRRLSYGTLFAYRGNEPALELAQRLVPLAPAPLSRVYLTGSGSESVELAIKLSRLYFALQGQPHRYEVLYLDQSYHGTFFGSMGVTGLFDHKERFAPLLPGLTPVPAPLPAHRPADQSEEAHALACAAAVERRAQAGRVAAVILEPVLGSAGVVPLPRAYLDRVQAICRQYGILLVLDEVATGFGRTGRWFAAEHWGLRPDLMLLSKGINSGYLPLGAVLFSEEVAQVLLQHRAGIGHGSSHNGNPACCAAALATIDVMQREGLVERAAEMGGYFCRRLEGLRRHPVVAEVRGLGLMLALELQPQSPERLGIIYAALQESGVLAYPFRSGLSFFPALTIGAEEIDTAVDRLDRILAAVGGR